MQRQGRIGDHVWILATPRADWNRPHIRNCYALFCHKHRCRPHTWLAGLAALTMLAVGPWAGLVLAAGPRAAPQGTSNAMPGGVAGQPGAVALPLDMAGTHYVYVDNGSAQNSITGYQATSAGLTPLSGSPYLTGGSGGAYSYGGNLLAISPNHQCVFAADGAGGTFNAFRINRDGSLTQVAHVPVEEPFPAAVTVAPQGGAVFLGSNAASFGAIVDSFSLGAGCAISEAQRISVGNRLAGMAIATNGSKLFVSSDVGKFIQTYAVAGTALQLVQTTGTNLTEPEGLASVGSFLFGSGDDDEPRPAETAAYTVAARGRLAPLPGSPAQDEPARSAIATWVDQADRQVISSEYNSFGLYGWRHGAYTLLAHALGAGTYMASVMTQLGHWLLVTNVGGSSISPGIVGRGTLVCLVPIYLPVAGGPNGIASF
jgi:hypothetical protein